MTQELVPPLCHSLPLAVGLLWPGGESEGYVGDVLCRSELA